jgi:quercetin dioxygenase-like cupin family protein
MKRASFSVRQSTIAQGAKKMSGTEPITKEARFDLGALEAEIRREEAYSREGYGARTLVRESDLRVVFIAMKAAARMAQHRAKDTVSIHAVAGQLRLHLPEKVTDLSAGQLLVLERGLPHDVEAVTDGAFLLTLGSASK